MPEIDSQKLQEAKDFYRDRIKGWMIADLEKSLLAETNFLTALGCLVYTEIIGIFLPPITTESRDRNMARFYRAFYRLRSSEQLEFLDTAILRETNKRLYQHLRHNMAHKYFPTIEKRTGDLVLFIPSVVARDGISSIPDAIVPPVFFSNDEVGQTRVVIAFRNYIDELKILVDESMIKTFEENEPNYQASAVSGVDVVLRGALR